MKRSWLMLLLAGVLSTSLLFTACDQLNNVTNPGENGARIVGTWVLSQEMVNGELQDHQMTLVFNEDNTGVMYSYEPPSDSTSPGGVTNDDFTWSVSGDTLNAVVTDTSGSTTNYDVSLLFVGDDMVTFEGLGSDETQMFARFSGQISDALVGEWMIQSRTLNGEDQIVGSEQIVLNSDGTGTHTAGNTTDNFNWSVSGNTLVVLNTTDQLGMVFTFSMDSTGFQLTETTTEGALVSVVVPYTPNDNIDMDLVGSWVLGSRTVNGDPEFDLTTVVFAPNGTGTTVEQHGDMEEPSQTAFNWETSNGTLTLSPSNPDTTFSVSYTVADDVFSITYTDENSDQIAETFYMVTLNFPDDYVGLLAQTDVPTDVPAYDQDIYKFNPVGTGHLVTYHENQEGVTTDEKDFLWSVNGDHLIVINPDNQLGMVFQVNITQDDNGALYTVTGMKPDGEFTHTYRRFSTDVDVSFVGSWVAYETDVDSMATFLPAKVTLSDDGTGHILQVQPDSTGSDNVYDGGFQWYVGGSNLLVINEDLTLQVMSLDREGDMMTIVEPSTMFTPPLIMHFVFETGDLDPNLPGNWTKTGETVDGTPSTDFGATTVTLGTDGTGEYAEEGQDTQTFTWTTSNGFMLTDMTTPDMQDYPTTAMEYELTGDTLNVTSHDLNGEDMQFHTTVETFTRQ